MRATPSRPVVGEPNVRRGTSLAAYTSLGLGGEALGFVTVTSPYELKDALRYADDHGMPVLILGGGSNLVVADAGFDGLVIALRTRGLTVERQGDIALLHAEAGEPWDEVVERSVSEDLAGLECLSGIPGLAGATPIQNVGAYGQEVSQTLKRVEVLDRQSLKTRVMTADECEFGYRDSLFKRNPGAHIVLRVSFELEVGGRSTLRYGELRRALEGSEPNLREVREQVLRLRRQKSMVLDPDDPNSRSAGSFFTNPVVDEATLADVCQRAVDAKLVDLPDEVPRYAAEADHFKLAAGWLIEHAGIAKGTRRGGVGVSAKHALALVHHGGGSAMELIELAREVQRAVHTRFGVTLTPEPVMVGFEQAPLG